MILPKWHLEARATTIGSGNASSLYQLVGVRNLELYVASNRASANLMMKPECRGSEFQRVLSEVLRAALTALIGSNDRLARAIVNRPSDVVYILRGGLNFGLHTLLPPLTGVDSEVSFVSSQRIMRGKKAAIVETDYQKWSVQDRAVLWIGDISATGTTLRHVLTRALDEYTARRYAPAWIVVVTIGTWQAARRLEATLAGLSEGQRSVLRGIVVLFIEAAFDLYAKSGPLAQLHLPYTDFIRLNAISTPEFELASLSTPTSVLERCAIYDGGSRSYEPGRYLENVRQHWKMMRALPPDVTVETVIRDTSEWLDYRGEYDDWERARPFWKHIDREQLYAIYATGQVALRTLCDRRLPQICDERLLNLAPSG